jgi:mono/diheme cytochrome c family protein
LRRDFDRLVGRNFDAILHEEALMILRFLFTVTGAFLALAVTAEEPIHFAQQIQPILAEHCVKCHGEAKAQGRMRLDSVAAIEEKLAADPALLVAGKPDESELSQRLVLPEDSAKRMPKGADPLPKSQIELIAAWIKQGAAFSAAAAVAPSVGAHPEPKTEKPTLPVVLPASQTAIDRLTTAGARVTPLYASSNLLEISFAGGSNSAGDADLALLADVADQVYTLNLADSKVTSVGLAPLAALKNLARLHLERSSATDEGLEHLSALPQLQYLNLYGTPITDAGLAHVAGLKQLNRLYLWQTKVSYDAAMNLERDIPGLMVNLGFDHPEVVKRRLTKELEAAKVQVETAKSEVVNAKQQFEQAEKDAKSSAERLAELEQQLKALDAPADGS